MASLCLCVVPHQHAIGQLTDPALARQVIPASDRQGGSRATRTRAAQHLDLARSQIEQRCHHDDVRSAVPHQSIQLTLTRQGALDGAEPRNERPAAERSNRNGDQLVMRRSERRHIFAHALAQTRRVVVSRLEVPEVVEPYANRGGQLGPRVRTKVLPAPSDLRQIGEQVFGVDARSNRVAPIREDFDVMSPSRQGAQHRFVHPKRPEVPHGEQQSHSRIYGTWSGSPLRQTRKA